jgi:hypothetical protein
MTLSRVKLLPIINALWEWDAALNLIILGASLSIWDYSPSSISKSSFFHWFSSSPMYTPVKFLSFSTHSQNWLRISSWLTLSLILNSNPSSLYFWTFFFSSYRCFSFTLFSSYFLMSTLIVWLLTNFRTSYFFWSLRCSWFFRKWAK